MCPTYSRPCCRQIVPLLSRWEYMKEDFVRQENFDHRMWGVVPIIVRGMSRGGRICWVWDFTGLFYHDPVDAKGKTSELNQHGINADQ
jgi:hypothetical protein